MKLANHQKMGIEIFNTMVKNNMPLKKSSFLLGNLWPDLMFSFIITPHNYSVTSSYISRLAEKLLDYKEDSQPIILSFYLGVITHYICDYFCFTHNDIFKGGVRQHCLYEKKQEFRKERLFTFISERIVVIDYETLLKKLHVYITQWESMLCKDMELSEYDIEFATYIATWFSSSLYGLLNKLSGMKVYANNIRTLCSVPEKNLAS